jgi:chromosome segregation ATPase
VNTLELAVTGPHVQASPLLNAELEGRVAALETGLTRVEARVEALSPHAEVSAATHEEQSQVVPPETGLNHVETKASALDLRVESLTEEVEKLNKKNEESTKLIEELSAKNKILGESINNVMTENTSLRRRLDQLEESNALLRHAREQNVHASRPQQTNARAASARPPRENLSNRGTAAPTPIPKHILAVLSIASAAADKREKNRGKQTHPSKGRGTAGLFSHHAVPISVPASASVLAPVAERSEDDSSQVRSLSPAGLPSE